MIIIGWDPGSTQTTAGYAAMRGDDVLAYGQGSTIQLFREVHEGFKASDELILFVCEEVFVGVNPRSAITLAKAQGELRGFHRATGMLTGGWWWEPSASTWRAMLGFTMRQPAPTKKNPAKTRPTNAVEFMEQACARASAIVGRRFEKDSEHAADAVCIARAGVDRYVELQRGPRQPSLLTT